MADNLSPELQALREKSLALAAELVKLRDDASLTDKVRADAVREASKKSGVYTMARDGAGAMQLLVVREALASKGVAHLAGIWGADAGVLAGVKGKLKETHLDAVLDGTKKGGLGITEPAGAPRPTWARVEGDELVITGAKSYVTGGQEADFVTALVQIEGQGPSMVVIDTNLPGVTIERRFSSLDGSKHAAFRFENVRVPRHHAIGRPGEGGELI